MGYEHPTRRRLLGGVGLAAMSGFPARLGATQVPEAAVLLAPGPEEGGAALLAQRAATSLARGLVQATALRVHVLGGPDGITAANRFASSAAPDGRVLLLLPGLAAQAQMVGDGRARYEPRRWPAICGSVHPCVVAGRGALGDTTPLRLALPGPAAPETAALLALDLLGRRAVPVFGLAGAAAEAAVRQGVADALPICGATAGNRAEALGLACWFAFDTAGQARDVQLPDVPAFGELLPDPPRTELVEAVRAAAAALRARAVIVLPPLTSADVVALWRGAAQRWAEEAPDAWEAGGRRIGPGEATVLLSTLCPPPEVALAYREWLLQRLNWQAG
jgi:hypothetical protein